MPRKRLPLRPDIPDALESLDGSVWPVAGGLLGLAAITLFLGKKRIGRI